MSGIHILLWMSNSFLSFKEEIVLTIVTKLSLGVLIVCSFLLFLHIYFSWLMIELLSRLDSPHTLGILQVLTELLQLITWKGNE